MSNLNLNLKEYGENVDNVRKRIGNIETGIIEIYHFDKEQKENIINLISNTEGDSVNISIPLLRDIIKKNTNFGDTVDLLSDDELNEKVIKNRELELMNRELTLMLEEIAEDIWYKQAQEIKVINSVLNIIQKSSDVNDINNKLNKILKKNKVKSIEELINKNAKR